jgi:carboxylesterase
MIHNPQLEGSPFYWEGGSEGILLIHGFSATTAEVRPLGKTLHSAGYTIAGPLLPGHFTNPDDLNRVHWQEWVNTVEEMYQRLSLRCNKIVVGGESTGALLSLHLANQHPEIAALLLYAPALRLNLTPVHSILLQLLAPFIPWLYKKDMDSNDLWQGYPVNPLKGVRQLIRLQKIVRSVLPGIRQPVLIIQGKLDTTVHPEVPDFIYNQVRSTIKEMYWMDQSAHCVILDRELNQVAALTLQFLHRVLRTEATNKPS